MNNICVANRSALFGVSLNPDPEANKRGAFNRSVGQPRNDRAQSTLIYQGGGGIFISSSPGTRVYNNTCYLNEGDGVTVEGPLREETGQPMSTRDCRVITQLILRKTAAFNIVMRLAI